MEIPKHVEEKIVQLQLIEQALQNITLQKQTFQTQLLEIESAMKELEKTEGPVYKIVGGIMVLSNKDELKKELQSRKEIIELRIKNLKKQEGTTKERAERLQAEVTKELEPKK